MRVGFAKLEITPSDSKYLSGFARLRKANGKVDNLYVKTVIFEVGEECFGILSYDLVAIDQLIIQSVQQKIKDHHQKGT